MATIKLRSNDDKIFTMDAESVKHMITIRRMFEDLGMDDDDEEPISCLNVDGLTLKKVIEWCTYHKDDPAPPEETPEDTVRRTDDHCPWDVEFFKTDHHTLCLLIMAADFFHCPGLLQAASKSLAKQVSGKSPEKIREIFNIENDFTPQEEEQLRKDNEWIDEL